MDPTDQVITRIEGKDNTGKSVGTAVLVARVTTWQVRIGTEIRTAIDRQDAEKQLADLGAVVFDRY